jgi:hypothetical protein
VVVPPPQGARLICPEYHAIMKSVNLVSTITVLIFTSVCAMGETKNLLPNGNFEGKEPLKGWLTGFPHKKGIGH